MQTWPSLRYLVLGLVTAVAAAGGAVQAQSRENAATGDPRVDLKPGFRDAGQAVLNIELVSTLPKPDGFFDPKAPAGTTTPPERPADAATPDADAPAQDRPGPAAAQPPQAGAGVSIAVRTKSRLVVLTAVNSGLEFPARRAGA